MPGLGRQPENASRFMTAWLEERDSLCRAQRISARYSCSQNLMTKSKTLVVREETGDKNVSCKDFNGLRGV